MGRKSSRRQKNESMDLSETIKALLLVIVIVIFSYVINGLTYLFELISQYKLALGIISIFIIIGAVVLYKKKLENTSHNRDENIIDITPIAKDFTESSHKNSIMQIQDVQRQPFMIDNEEKNSVIESKLKSNIDSDFQKLIEFLESPVVSFVKRDIKKEKDYQDELWGQLRQKFYKQYPLEYEAQMGRHRLDILFNNSIGIELKVYYGGKDTRRQLQNQISEYSENYQKMIGLVVNATNENNDIVKQDIEKLLSRTRIEKDDYKIIIK